MQKIILLLFLSFLIIPLSVITVDNNVFQNIAEINSLSECEEFKKLADKYYDKSKKNKLYEKQFLLVAKNYKKNV